MKSINHRSIIWVSLGATVLGFINLRAYPPLVSLVSRQLKISNTLGDSTLTLAWLALCVGTLVGGICAEYWGRRRVFLYGLFIFMIGTLTEYVSEALWLLNIGRILEAGGLIFMILNGVLLRDTLDDPKERARAFAGIIIASSIGSLLAPILAEVSLLSWGWHAVFLSILVLGAILFIFAYLRLPETTPTPNPKRAPLYIVAKQMIMDPRIIWLTLLYILYVGFFQLFFVQLSRLLVDQRGIPDKFFVLFFAVITLGCLFGSFGSKRLRHWRDEYSIAHFALLAPILGFFTLIFCGLLLLVWSPPLWLSIGLILLAFFEALIGYGLAVPNILSIILVDYRSTNAFSSSFYRFLWSLGVALETTLLSHLPSGKKLLVLYFGILTGLIIVLTVACRRYFQISKKT